MRAIWTGAIGFGLVNIPIKIFSAIESSKLDLDMLDKKDHANIHYKRVNANSGKEVAWENIVKGYRLNDEYVILDDEDFDEALPEKTKMISLESFVAEKEIDSIYFNTPYYLEPQKGGERAYALLQKSLAKTNTVGLGTYVMRSVENLVIIRPYEKMLLLNKLYFEEELRDTADLKIPSTRIKKSEMDMAVQLIKQHRKPFSIEGYKDEYSKALLKIIKNKAKGKHTKTRKIKVDYTKSDDLLANLKASLA